MSLLLFLFLFPITLGANPARKIVVHKDEVVTVKTAPGIATIIQVPDQPTSVVLGDSAAFKVEYLNQAITIKPLHAHAVSNLYIHTDFERYSVKLVTGLEASADYVVYLAPFEVAKSESKAASLEWKRVGARRKSEFGQFVLARIATTPTSVLLEFEITPRLNSRIDPGSFWLLQGKSNRPIQDLLLSTLDAKKGQPLTATLVIRKSDLLPGDSAAVEIRMESSVSFSLGELLWKK